MKTISNTQEENRSRFAKEQEGAKKDVQRASAVFQSCWAIVRHHSRTWSADTMWEVMTACMIMHHMIVEDDCICDQ